MSKLDFPIIKIFQQAEKKAKILQPSKEIHYEYVLYEYDNGEEEVKYDNLFGCLDRIPTKYQIVDDAHFIDKCIVLEMNAYTLNNENKPEKISNFKVKFGYVKKKR